ncbi:hypothetical protein VB636_00660, partial [Paracoccus sp. APAP_BH8]
MHQVAVWVMRVALVAAGEDAATLFLPRFSNGLTTPPVALIADPATHQDNRALGLALAEGRGVLHAALDAVALDQLGKTEARG